MKTVKYVLYILTTVSFGYLIYMFIKYMKATLLFFDEFFLYATPSDVWHTALTSGEIVLLSVSGGLFVVGVITYLVNVANKHFQPFGLKHSAPIFVGTLVLFISLFILPLSNAASTNSVGVLRIILICVGAVILLITLIVMLVKLGLHSIIVFPILVIISAILSSILYGLLRLFVMIIGVLILCIAMASGKPNKGIYQDENGRRYCFDIYGNRKYLD